MRSTGYPGHVFAGLALAVAGLVLFAFPLLSTALAVAAIVVVSIGRAQFRANDELKGASLAVLALVIGALTLAYLALTYLFPLLLLIIFGAPTGG